MFSGAIVLSVDCWSTKRPALKNHRRSFMTGPPNVYSYCGTTRSVFDEVPLTPQVSHSSGAPVATLPTRYGCASLPVTNARQLSLLSVSRNDPVNVLPPDFVTMLTTPPLKWPNSAETPSLATVVS